MLIGILRVLLSLARMFLALGVVIAVVSFGGRTMGLRRGLVMFRCLVVSFFHSVFLWLAEKSRRPSQATSIVFLQGFNCVPGGIARTSGAACAPRYDQSKKNSPSRRERRAIHSRL